MNIILLSGGSGKRLWPLSNDVRSKQFIKLFKNDDEYESMVQRVYRQITTVDADAKITIATSKSQASAIKNQLGEKASICVEPCRRDTFPAIALAAAYLHDELGVAESAEPVRNPELGSRNRTCHSRCDGESIRYSGYGKSHHRRRYVRYHHILELLYDRRFPCPVLYG